MSIDMITETSLHRLFFGDPKKGAKFCIEIPEAPTPDQQENLKTMLNLYYAKIDL